MWRLHLLVNSWFLKHLIGDMKISINQNWLFINDGCCEKFEKKVKHWILNGKNNQNIQTSTALPGNYLLLFVVHVAAVTNSFCYHRVILNLEVRSRLCLAAQQARLQL